jgi:hypothetical protein
MAFSTGFALRRYGAGKTEKKMTRIIFLRSLIILFLSVFLFVGCRLSISNPFGWGPSLDSGAFIETYVDLNANGIKDENEPPLAHVCVWGGEIYSNQSAGDLIARVCSNSYNYTDSKGQWNTFFAGSNGKDIILFAVAPQGFQPTTNLAINNPQAKFGFIPAGSVPPIKVRTLKEVIDNKILVDYFNLAASIGLCIAISIFVSLKLIRTRNISVETSPIQK